MNGRTVASAVLTSVALVLLVIEVLSWPHSARFAPTVTPATACSLRIADVGAADHVVGLQDGDRLLLSQMDEPSRIAVVYHDTPTQAGHAGDHIGLVVQRGERVFPIAYLLEHTDSLARFFAQLGFKVFIVIVGIFVLWRGRDRASLVLGIWCLGVAVAVPDAWWGNLGVSGRLAGGALTAALWTFSPFMLYLVVESIATGVSRRAVLVARAFMTVTVAPALIVNTINATAQARTGCAVVHLSPSTVNGLFASSQLVIIGFFVVSYLRTAGLARQRVRWVFWSFMVSRFGVLLNLFNRLVVHPIHLSGIEWLTVMLFPLGCAYAIIKHRIIDVRFIVSRTLVYGIISTVVIGVVVLVEWVAGAWLVSASRTVSAVIGIAVALSLGLSLRSLYSRVDQFIDAVLFRQQFEARALVARMAAGLPYAESTESIADVLTRVVCEKLQIASAALFRRHDGGGFQREAAHGWALEDQLQEKDFERLSVAFEGSMTPLGLLNFSFTPGDCLPRGLAAPILGLPLYIRRQNTGVVLYSGHADSTDLDPVERRLLVEVAAAAARGYDALELAARVEKANAARARAQEETIETLKTYSEAYERFVPGEFLKFLDKDSILGIRLGDHVLRDMTVFFSDIRSFTSISERMTPEQLFTFLNEYLKQVGPLVRENGGFIDKYIGDAVMGLFPSKPDDALRAAIALQREVRLFNRRLEDEGLPVIAAGVGLHSGVLMLGTIGERGRMDTTVIADAVNTASRLETATKLYRCSILVSHQTVGKLSYPDRFLLRSLGSVKVKGKVSSVEIYECYDADPAELVLHKSATRERFINAVATFESGNFVAASEAFAIILAANANDGPAGYFLERCSEHITAG